MGLVALVVEHHEELEYDLLPEIDLLDAWRGRLSFRRLDVLIRHLATDSATFRAMDPDAAEAASWSTSEHLQALSVDLFGKANFKNYEPLERPHQRVEKRRREAAFSRALEAQRLRQIERERLRASTGSGS